MKRYVRTWAALLLVQALSPTIATADDPVVSGYSNYAEMARRTQALDSLDAVSVKSLAKTSGGKEVFLITIGTEDVQRKPAIVIVGNVVAPHLVGSEIALGMAESIAKNAGDAKVKALLDRVTIYVIPRPNPDGSERFFVAPYFDVDGNARKTDDDRDFSFGEDPPEDMNKDGFITQMRVSDPLGDQVPHPDDPRILVTADPKKNEKAAYKVYLEGIDNDHDQKWNEDPGAGVSFNRNFPAKYPYFGEHAGENSVSELESRAVADFLFDHPNVAAILTFSPEDNLFHPWKAAGDAASQKIKTSVQPDDVPLLDPLAERYREIHGGKECPAPPVGAGSFSDWAYLQYGRWSFAARAWWIPPADKPKDKKESDAANDAEKPRDEPARNDQTSATSPRQIVGRRPNLQQTGATPLVPSSLQYAKAPTGRPDSRLRLIHFAAFVDEPKQPPDGKKNDKTKKKEDDRAKDLRRALQWFAENNIQGFTDWTPIDHPDFPGKKVEVGGIRPFFLLNPPSDQFAKLVDIHVEFISVIADRLPKLAIHDVKIEPAGAGVFRVTLRVANEGHLPTMSKMGQITRIPHPLNWEIQLGKDDKILSGTRRGQIAVLSGSGGNTELEWLLLVPGDNPKASFVVASPSVGEVIQDIPLAGK